VTSAKFIDNLKADLTKVRYKINVAQEQQRAATNAHRRPKSFIEGDKMLIKATVH
jgi:hypothetical protein